MKEWSNKPSSGQAIANSGTVPAALASGGSSALSANSSSILTTASTSTSVTQKVVAGVAVLAPLTVGVVVGGVAAVCYGVANMVKYGEGEKSGASATRDTVVGSSGLGISAGLGVAAGNAIAGTTMVLGSTVVAPIAIGTGAAYACAKIWNKLFFNGKKDSKKKTKTK